MQKLRPVSITHPDHFVNVARRQASQTPNSIFANQFENLANFRAHLKTGEEIWQQSGHSVDAFVCGAGTGGTIAGDFTTNIQDPYGATEKYIDGYFLQCFRTSCLRLLSKLNLAVCLSMLSDGASGCMLLLLQCIVLAL